MTTEWDISTLGIVGEWLSGGTPSKQDPDLWAGPIPWVSPKDMKRPRLSDAVDHVSHKAVGSGTQMAPVGSVLMVVRGMILAHTFPVALTTVPLTFNQDIKALVPGIEWSAEYLLYWLQSHAPYVLRLVDVANHGTKRLPSERLFALSVPRPPLPEQRKIAAILSSVDEAIEATQSVIDQLQVVKKAMMAELLTRGLPGRDTRFKQTEIGDVPEGWEVVRMESLSVLITKGESPGWQGFEYQDDGVLFVTSENVRDGLLDLEEPKFIPPDFARKISRSRLVPGDVLVNIVGASIGRAALWQGEYQEANVNQAVAVVRPIQEKLIPRLLLDALYTPRGQAYFGTSKVDNARPNVSLTNLRDFVMVVPPISEQQNIASIGDALDGRLLSETRALSALQKTSSALSSALLTGEIRVKPDEATP